jgi:hypothetical protein
MKIKEGRSLDKMFKKVSVNMAFHDLHMNRLKRIRRMYAVGGERDVGPYYGQANPSLSDEIADLFYEAVRRHLSRKHLEYGTQIVEARVFRNEYISEKTDSSLPKKVF